VQLLVFDRLAGFAKTREDEIDFVSQRAAEIVNSNRAAMGQRKREVGGNDQHAQFVTPAAAKKR